MNYEELDSITKESIKTVNDIRGIEVIHEDKTLETVAKTTAGAFVITSAIGLTIYGLARVLGGSRD